MIALVPAAGQAARRGRLVGKIVDPDDKPLQGVTVTATSPDLPAFKKVETTDKKGVFGLDFDKIDVTYHYRFDKTGYDSLEVNQQWTKDGSEFVDWTLHPATVQMVEPGNSPVITATSTSAPAVQAFNSGLAAFKAKDNATAEAKFRETLELGPNLQVSLVGLATAGVKIGRNAEAIAAVETILKADPKNEAAIRIRYNAALALGDKGKLIDALVSITPYEPTVGRDGLARLAFEAYDANDLPTARERFLKVLEIAPDYPQAYYYIGVIDAGRGRERGGEKAPRALPAARAERSGGGLRQRDAQVLENLLRTEN